MAHVSRFRGPTRTSRRSTAWGVGPSATNIAVSSSTPQLWTLGSVLQLDDKSTIVRIRGHGLVLLESATAADDGFVGAVGIGIVTTAAFTAGVTAVPTPITEEDWEGWMWHQYISIQAFSATANDIASSLASAQRFEIDSKAMRKQNADETLFGAIELTLNGTAVATFNARTRVLDKLH